MKWLLNFFLIIIIFSGKEHSPLLRWAEQLTHLHWKQIILFFFGLFPFYIPASAAGHQAEADRPVRPGEECRPAPHRALDGGEPLQRHRGGLEPRDAGP